MIFLSQGLPIAADWGVHESRWLAGCVEGLSAKHAPHQADDICLSCRWWHGLPRQWAVSTSDEGEGEGGRERKREREREWEREREGQSVNYHIMNFILAETQFTVTWLLETFLCTKMSMAMCKQRWRTLDSQGELILFCPPRCLNCAMNNVTFTIDTCIQRCTSTRVPSHAHFLLSGWHWSRSCILFSHQNRMFGKDSY